MKKTLLVATAGIALLVCGCALFPRRDTVAYPAAQGPGSAPSKVFVDSVDVDRRVLTVEVARDAKDLVSVLAPGHGFAVVSAAEDGAWPVRLHIVERETIRDFSPQYAIMVSLEMYSSSVATEPSLTVVHTGESADSISSPWTLKRILNDCLQTAAKAFAEKRG
jgi:hypothetical protein